MAVAASQMKSDDASSQLTALAAFLTAIGISIAITQRSGIGDLPRWAFQAYGISALLQSLLLCGALAVRLRDAEYRERWAQATALRLSQESERITARMVEKRTRELAQARKTAEDALRAEKEAQLHQVRFLEVVSHQYRTPLAAIRSNIDSIGLSLPHTDEGNAGRIKRIRRAVVRLTEILDINLARSRLQGPSFRVEMSDVAMGDIVSAACARARDLLNEPNLQVSLDPEASAQVIWADAEMLELSIINLLENAFKYSTLATNSSVELSLERSNDHIMIAITDHGIGIPASDLPHIFENARRGSNARSIEGSGLGLFLVAKVVAAHKGTIEAESIEGKGTTIRMRLPIAPA
jgi:two-component system, sensor histidine kinase LadS